MKKATITKLERSNNQDGTPFKDRYNNFYFNVELDNGDTGICASQKDPAWFKIGDNLEYAYEDRGADKKAKIKFTHPNADGQQHEQGGQKQQPKENGVSQLRKFAIEYSTNLASLGHANWVKDKLAYWQNVKEIEEYLVSGRIPFPEESKSE